MLLNDFRTQNIIETQKTVAFSSIPFNEVLNCMSVVHSKMETVEVPAVHIIWIWLHRCKEIKNILSTYKCT